MENVSVSRLFLDWNDKNLKLSKQFKKLSILK